MANSIIVHVKNKMVDQFKNTEIRCVKKGILNNLKLYSCMNAGLFHVEFNIIDKHDNLKITSLAIQTKEKNQNKMVIRKYHWFERFYARQFKKMKG